jgi:hypothetical protein
VLEWPTQGVGAIYEGIDRVSHAFQERSMRWIGTTGRIQYSGLIETRGHVFFIIESTQPGHARRAFVRQIERRCGQRKEAPFQRRHVQQGFTTGLLIRRGLGIQNVLKGGGGVFIPGPGFVSENVLKGGVFIPRPGFVNENVLKGGRRV